MNRRNFIQQSLAAAATPLMVSGTSVFAWPGNTVEVYKRFRQTGNILVLIQLQGGNDGLNTLVPVDQYDKLLRARPQVILPEFSLLPLAEATRIHPKMEKVYHLFREGKVGVLQSVGYPLPNQSHFRSTDIWETASASDEVLNSGWMGRYLDREFPGFPVSYPNPQYPDPLAITMGSTVSTTCQGPISNMSLALRNLNQFIELPIDGAASEGSPLYQRERDFIRRSMVQTNAYFEVLKVAANKGKNLSSLYPKNGNSLANQLKVVARLIAGGLHTPVYAVKLGGFDTHANQVQANEPNTEGVHAQLLWKLSEAVYAFMDDLKRLGLADRVLAMTYSEFGRRIASNASYGTDHGTAAPQFVFGTQVNPLIHGKNPLLPIRADQRDNLPMQFDFRSVYGSILEDWMGLDTPQVRELIYEDYVKIPIIGSSHPERPENLEQARILDIFPNPSATESWVSLEKTGGYRYTLELYDSTGRRVRTLRKGMGQLQQQIIPIELTGLNPGTYYVRFESEVHREIQPLTIRP